MMKKTTKKEVKKIEKEEKKAGSPTTTTPATPNGSCVTSQSGDSNTPKKSKVTGHDADDKAKKTPNKSHVMGQAGKTKDDKKSETSPKTKEKMNVRSTTWTFILYEDSTPKNWKQILKRLHVPFVISPRHDMDLKADGSKKKPHYHCIVRFRSKKSYKQIIEEVCAPLGAPIPQPVADFAMLVRYLVHLDDPEKYQYDPDDVESYGNIDVRQYLYSDKAYQFLILKDILDFCERFNVTEYSTIVNYAKDEKPSWFSYVTKIFRSTIDSYVRSLRYQSEHDSF